MNQPSRSGDATAGGPAAELREVILAVDGVAEVYPARPLWQTIAGAARSAVTGEPLPAVLVEFAGAAAVVRTRVGVSGVLPAPDVARAVAAAIRTHLGPQPATVQVQIVQIRNARAGDNPS
jgi:hypothetical protein